MVKPSGSMRDLKDALGHQPMSRTAQPHYPFIPLSQIRPNPDQPRRHFDQSKLKDLANSIRQHGVLQPILVRRDPNAPKDQDLYIIIAGERRYRASELAGKRKIPVIFSGGKDYEKAIIENIQREDLLPIEEAEGYAKLIEDFGYSQEEVAKRVGKTRTVITEIIRLTTLPDVIKEECRTCDIPKKTLLQLALIGNEDQQIALWEKVKTGEYTVSDLRQIKQQINTKSGRRKTAPPVEKLIKAEIAFERQLDRIRTGKIEIDKEMRRKLLQLADKIRAAMSAL